MSVKVRALFVALLLLLFFPIVSIEAQPSQKLMTHHVPAVVAREQAKPLGPLPATKRLNLSIVLPLRNQGQLRSLLARLYDPTDPMYRKFLSVPEFTGQFGPTQGDYRAVVQFAKANGMTITGDPANRLIVPVTATVAQVQRAFHVQMNLYQHPTENRTFFSPDREPELPQGISVQHIVGLNNYSLPRPMHAEPAKAQVASPAKAQGSGPDGSYLGVDMRAAYYGGTELTGSGQVVGLLQFDGYNPNDVNLTFTNSGITNAVPIKNVLLDGATGATCQFMWFACEDAEEVLDIVQAAEMAPGLAEIRVYIGNLDADILNAMAVENVAKQLSISWTWSPEDPVTDDVFFEEFAAQGQSVFVASGDAGAFSPNVSDYFYPAEDEFVTAVGGTSLVTNGGLGPWVSETAWSYSGGGISPDGLPIADWQAGVANSANQGSTKLRNIPDVAMEADFDNYNCSMGVCQTGWAGTSFAAPRWAAFAALVNQQAAESGSGPIGFLNPALYNIGKSALYATAFHDITSGKNDDAGGWPVPYQIFSAVPGYDLVTGWGSPTGQSLIDALAPKSPSGFQLSSSIAQLAIAPGNSGSATITIKPNAGFGGSVNFTIAGLPDGVVASWSTNPATVSSQLTLAVANSAVRGSYLVTVTGTSGSATATTTVALLVDAPGFSILPSHSVMDVRPGLQAGTEIEVTRYRGFSGPVTLAITSPLPSGVTAVWDGNPAQDQALLTLSATRSAPLATTILTITATSGSLTATTTISADVGRPGFWLNVAPLPEALIPGGQLTSTVSILPIGDFNEPTSLSATHLPAGITASFSPATITPGQSSVMTLTAAANTALGNNEASEVVGTAADSVGEDTIQYSVIADPVPSFDMVATPAAVTIQQGQSTVVNVATTAHNGFNDTIGMWGIPDLPQTISYAFSANSFPVGSSTQLTLTASLDALPGNYLAGIGGQNQRDVWAAAALSITVIPASSLSLGMSPSSLQVSQGDSAAVTATLTSNGNAVQNPTFTVVSALPDGLSASVGAGQSQGTGVLTFNALDTVPTGSYTVNIAATSGSETVNAPVTLNITKPVSTFTIAATAVTVKTGNSALSTITLGSTNGYSGTIALSCSVTAGPQGAQDLPTCTAGPSVTLGSNASSVATTVTVSTTAATTGTLARPRHLPGRSPWGTGGGLVLAGWILMIGRRSRRKFHSLPALVLVATVIGALFLSGCGGTGVGSSGGSGNAPSTPANPGTTAGTYTVTVTAKGNDALTTSASATFTLIVQ